jgi:hypothetical protein
MLQELPTSKGCYFLNGCSTCATSGCVAVYQLATVEAAMVDAQTRREQETAVCALLATRASGGDRAFALTETGV